MKINNETHIGALKESFFRLSACLIDLAQLLEDVPMDKELHKSLRYIFKNIECVRDRLGEMERGD